MSKEKFITIRAPEDLKREIRSYAERHKTNITQLTLDYYRKLLEEDMKQEAEQF